MSVRRTITIKSNKPIAVISIEEYESMKDTIALLSQNPNLVRELKAEHTKIGKGNFISFEDFKKK